MERYTLKIGRRDRGAYISDEALNVETSEDVDSLPDPIANVVPPVKRKRDTGFTVFEAPAGQHSDIEWYSDVLEDRDCEVVNIDCDRQILSVVVN